MSDELPREDLAHAKVLWDFHRLETPVGVADFILALGSHDERVALHAAKLFRDGLAPTLVTSGSFGKITRDIWHVSEGERFAQIARQAGVPHSAILVEDHATNTGDNIVFSRRLLEKQCRPTGSGILVTMPYMERRAFAAAAKQWPEVRWAVSSPPLSFDDYPSDAVPLRRMVELMVGDLQRLKVYAAQGFQIVQDIPADVWFSFEHLRDAGYDRFVIREEPA